MDEQTKAQLKELCEGYEFRHGTIKNPGKFEGETIATLYYYDAFLNGGETVFEITDDEREAFGLNESDKFVYLAESNDGFVYLEYFETREEAEEQEGEDCHDEF